MTLQTDRPTDRPANQPGAAAGRAIAPATETATAPAAANTATSGQRRVAQPEPQSSATIDLDAISANVAALKSCAGRAEVMTVVKADAYSHGLVPVAKAALAGGATRLGAAVLPEAFALRAAGITAPIFAWLAAPGAAYQRAITEDIELAAYGLGQLAEIAGAAAAAGKPATIHLKADTGMWRGGGAPEDWPALAAAAYRAESDGLIEVEGVWSHLACADEPGHPSIGAQLAVFDDAVEAAHAAGLRPRLRHIANSAATLSLPASHFDMVRPGIATYGINPIPGSERDGMPVLRPAMTLAGSIIQAKRAPAGSGVSYGHTYVTERDTTLAVVPLGYADGIFRSAGGSAEVLLHGHRYPVVGRVCMDQFVIDVGNAAVSAGDRALLFGPGDEGEPTADDWAEASGTIAYEVLTRIGARVPRIYVGGPGR